MTSGITQNPHVSVVFLEGVQRRVALGSSVELGTRSRYAQFALTCYRAIPVDDDVHPLTGPELYSLGGQIITLPFELSRIPCQK
jgi:hypothetical protein